MKVAGTGHRMVKLGGYRDFWVTSLDQFAIKVIQDLPVRPDLGISGMALGWDQSLARAFCYLKIPWLAALPFEGQDSRWPSAAKEEYRGLLNWATAVEVVSPGAYTPWKMHARNRWMVDQLTDDSDRLLALWNGGDGGTANCIRYAMRNCPEKVVNYWNARAVFLNV